MLLKEKYTVTHTSPRNEGYATCQEAEEAKGRPGQRLYWGSHQEVPWMLGSCGQFAKTLFASLSLFLKWET